MRRVLAGWVLIFASAVRGAPVSTAVLTEPWPAAEALFRQDPRWLGADDAYSIDLGRARILWLFGDTFVAERAPFDRRHATMIRNSVGIQNDADPVHAVMRFSWTKGPAGPQSFLPEEAGRWYWPGDGVLVDGTLLLFLMQVHSVPTGLGFEVVGWRAVAVDNSEAPPESWRLRLLPPLDNAFGAVIGSGAVLRSGDWVYAFGSYERSPAHDICLVRWPAAAVAHGELPPPQWWDGERGAWAPQNELVHRPKAVFTDGQTEFSVHFDPALQRFIEIQTLGFGAAQIVYRTASRLTGPWSAPAPIFTPPEGRQPKAYIYAGKAHPELDAGGALALTYATNADWSTVLDRPDLYYPRVLKLRLPTTP